jgi:hypothetical protein
MGSSCRWIRDGAIIFRPIHIPEDLRSEEWEIGCDWDDSVLDFRDCFEDGVFPLPEVILDHAAASAVVEPAEGL